MNDPAVQGVLLGALVSSLGIAYWVAGFFRDDDK